MFVSSVAAEVSRPENLVVESYGFGGVGVAGGGVVGVGGGGGLPTEITWNVPEVS